MDGQKASHHLTGNGKWWEAHDGQRRSSWWHRAIVTRTVSVTSRVSWGYADQRKPDYKKGIDLPANHRENDVFESCQKVKN